MILGCCAGCECCLLWVEPVAGTAGPSSDKPARCIFYHTIGGQAGQHTKTLETRSLGETWFLSCPCLPPLASCLPPLALQCISARDSGGDTPSRNGTVLTVDKRQPHSPDRSLRPRRHRGRGGYGRCHRPRCKCLWVCHHAGFAHQGWMHTVVYRQPVGVDGVVG